MPTPEQMRPEQMRTAVARYVEEIHRAYMAQALTFPAAVRGRMPLLAPGPLTVAAVGARNLHVLATRDPLDEMSGAASAGLVRAHAMLAAAIAPRNEALSALAAEARPDPDAVRRELLAAVGGRTQWHPPAEQAGPAKPAPPGESAP